ncbi:MAG: hypothetical protein DIZ80_11735 [endosymbiont of Galathealinum brachiosum]|uniref:Uncharacterized protein n=1 Tax=endosymbiont of Galathealinum brachiosum TaxID=2200906 RepID=A0A370DED9_9GAMM|nr:MAG: hypothetical protein DIZ80_11735 [endosymbiont of Galathealinum brachiosum]
MNKRHKYTNTRMHIPLLLSALFFLTHSAQAEDKKLADKLLKGSALTGTKISSCYADSAILCPDSPRNSQKAYVCLMKHENKLSGQCKLGILDASITLKKQILAINHSIEACESSADSYCLDVIPGEWRIVNCLKKHETKLDNNCTTALKESGLWQQAK